MQRRELCFAFESLTRAYVAGALDPVALVDEVIRRIEGEDRLENVWLSIRSPEELREAARAVMARKAKGEVLPLYGLPFAVKDNIDVAGLPTTAGCAALAYVPEESAAAVQRLIDAGAIAVGKVNLDQLATGLVGTRSPFGTPTNSFDPRMIPGGSSSGSAVAVAGGHVSFALGTDTAGSGRVPAGFNNLVGLKPTRGVFSTRGVVPACRTLDCVSVFALTVRDAARVAEVMKGWDERDAFSRPDAGEVRFAAAPFQADGRGGWDVGPLATPSRSQGRCRVGVPAGDDLVFFGDDLARAAFHQSLERVKSLGCEVIEVDFRLFRETAQLLYEGPWVTERLFAAGSLLAEKPDALLPILRDILADAKQYDAKAAFAGYYRLREFRQRAVQFWRDVDVLLVPTSPTIYSVEAVLAEPRALNAKLGVYTNFVNLLDMAAIAVPGDFRADGLPAGITLLGPRDSDALLASLAEAHQRRLGGKLGATAHSVSAEGYGAPLEGSATPPVAKESRMAIAVVGAHLRGQPLNHELTRAGAEFVNESRTGPHYKFFALHGTTPPKPGLLRVERDQGSPIELEIWSLAAADFGRFVAKIPAPLCVGSIELEDGSSVQGFLCEAHAVSNASDISVWGGWRAYLAQR